MVKKLLFILLFLAVLGAAPFVYAHVINSISSGQAFLSVKELKGQDKVYIDHLYKGTTPLLNTPVSSGIHTIALERSNYYTFEKEISFTSNTNTLINTQLGPSETYTMYTILSSRKSNGSAGIIVTTDDPQQDNMQLTINGKSIQPDTILPESAGTYQLTDQKSGFIGIDNQIVLTKGYTLTDSIHLSRNPL